MSGAPLSRLLASNWAIVAMFAGLAVLFSLPVYAHLDHWGIQDWDIFFLRSSVGRASLLQYGQFPLWNPYSLGGMPFLAHPESNTLALSFLIEMLCGVVIGSKINITLHLFVGLCGTYFLARHYRQGPLAAVLAAFLLMFSSMYALTVTSGLVHGYAIAYMPWALLFFLKALEQFVWVFAAVLVLTAMWLAGGVYPFCESLLFLGTYTLIGLLLREWKFGKAALVLASIFGLTFFLGAVKFLPALEFTGQYPRHLQAYAGLSLEALRHGLFARDQSLAAAIGEVNGKGFLHGFTWGIQETGMYIGYLSFLLFIAGCIGIRGARRYGVLGVCVLLFVWLAFGDRSQPLSLWALVHQIPPYSLMRTVERFRYVFMLGLAVLAGAGLQGLLGYLHRRFPGREWPSWVGVGVVAVVLVDLFTVNSPVFRDAFPIPPIAVEAQGAFAQISDSYDYDQFGFVVNRPGDYIYQSHGASYPAFLANLGTVFAYENIPAPNKAVPASSPDYRGEVYLDGAGGSAAYRFWSPNRLVVEVEARAPGTLVINQNYYSGWRVKGGQQVESSNGLLAVRVDREVRRVELYYRPTSVVVGALISLTTMVGMGLWYWYLRRRGIGRLASGVTV